MGILFAKLSRTLESFGNQQSRVIMVGLDAAGKTTILYKLKLNEAVHTIPTIGEPSTVLLLRSPSLLPVCFNSEY